MPSAPVARRLGHIPIRFLMVLREGPELALILRAVELRARGLQAWIGTIVGIAAAVAVGLFFFKALRISAHRFFAATSVILMLVAFQLALTGLHELSEGRAAAVEQGGDGQILDRSYGMNVLFVLFLGGNLLICANAAAGMERTPGDATRGGDAVAENRKTAAAELDDGRGGRVAYGDSGATADFIYARANSAPPAARPIGVGKYSASAVAKFRMASLHLFHCDAAGVTAFHDH